MTKKMRCRRSLAERVIAEFDRQLRLVTNPKARHRSEGAKRGWETRRRNAEDDRASENLARMEAARIFGSDPTP